LTIFFDCASELWQQILWNKFGICCAYFTPNCTWSPNYSVLVLKSFDYFFGIYERHPCATLCKLVFSENHRKRKLFKIGRVAIRCTDTYSWFFDNKLIFLSFFPQKGEYSDWLSHPMSNLMPNSK
jgi:hypothetical protein